MVVSNICIIFASLKVKIYKHKKMKIIKVCPFCGKENVVEMTYEQYEQYVSGKGYVQNIFPNLSAEEREILISGICPKCWDETFK